MSKARPGVAIGIPTPMNCEVTLYSAPAPSTAEMLFHVGEVCLADPNPDSLLFDSERDELVFYHKVEDIDRQLHPILGGTDEIWVVIGSAPPEQVN